MVALAIPLREANGEAGGPLDRVEHALQPWVAFGVLPLFGFANVGVALPSLAPSVLVAPIPLGISAGPFLGKQLGIFGFVWAAVRLGISSLPNGVKWRDLYGVAVLGGIGFTMSLFIGSLAFTVPDQVASVRLGVLWQRLGTCSTEEGACRIMRVIPSVRRSKP